MTQDEQIQKILDLEERIRDTQTSKFSAHTLVPVGLVITIVGFSFAIGVNYQASNQTRLDLEQFKTEYKQNQIELKTDIKNISTQVQDIRVLILSNPSFSPK